MNNKAIFLCLESFYGEDCVWSLWLLFITKSFIFDTSGQATSLRASIFSTVEISLTVWHLIIVYWQHYQNVYVFSDEKSSSTTVLTLLSHVVSVILFFLTSFFVFSSEGFTNQRDFFSF